MIEVENAITLSRNDSDGEGRGSYVLLIELLRAETIAIGRLKAVHFRRGYYAYVGSAMGGFKARLNRHLRVNKRPHWHIDYLLEKASITSIIICPTQDTVECTIAQALSRYFDAIPGFGCSDCRCHSHLFFAVEGRQMATRVRAVTRLIAKTHN
ncbi:MAG: GIY-YIG nuclease family protein [Chloroflexi bacterium]|nr:GIY-YIG nuclease family protein [Chloroflexota bacterium]